MFKKGSDTKTFRYLGYDFDNNSHTVADVMKGTCHLSNCIVFNEAENIYYVPADITLATADLFLAQTMCREQVLRHAIVTDEEIDKFDYILPNARLDRYNGSS